MNGSAGEARDIYDRALEIATQAAELLNEMRDLAPGAVGVGPGRISGPGVQIVLTSAGFTVRT